MSKSEEKLLYKIIAQTEGITITAQINEDMTEDEVIKAAEEHTLHKATMEAGKYRNFIVLPVCTREQRNNGNINYCPRCGHKMEDMDENYYQGECWECNATLDIHITTYGETDKEEEDDE
jgi:hypothetical protein